MSDREEIIDGLAKAFSLLGARGVAAQIRKGEDVSANAEFGFRHSIHASVGPRVNVETWDFVPMTDRGRELEVKAFACVQTLLINGGFEPMPMNLLEQLKAEDEEFRLEVEARKR